MSSTSTPIERHVQVAPDVALHVLDRGPRSAERAFVLVHGLASNARLWDGVADRLAERGLRSVAVDLRGHGLSSKPDHGYDVPAVAQDVATLIDELGLSRPVVVGQSWGGNVVIELAARHREHLCAVVAVDGGFIELGSHFHSWEECRDALAPPRLVGTPRERMERWMRDAHSDWPESGIQGSLANFEVRADGTIAPWLTFERHLVVLRGLYEHRPSDLFPSITVPALLVPADTGDVSWTADKRQAVDAAVRALPDGRAHWFAPAHHDIHAQHPAELTAVLIDFAEEAASR